jgi:hypothetical protein
MLEIIAQVKAEAERELILAQAKIEVVNSIEQRFRESEVKQIEIEEVSEPCDETPVSDFDQM